MIKGDRMGIYKPGTTIPLYLELINNNTKQHVDADEMPICEIWLGDAKIKTLTDVEKISTGKYRTFWETSEDDVSGFYCFIWRYKYQAKSYVTNPAYVTLVNA